jgi:hypothetical protein
VVHGERDTRLLPDIELAADAHRLNCVYALDSRDSFDDLPGEPAYELFRGDRYPNSRYRTNYERVQMFLPAVVASAEHDELRLPGGAQLRCQRVVTRLLRLGSRPVGLLSLDIIEADLSKLITILDATCWGREQVLLDDRPLLQRLRAHAQGCHVQFGADVHQVFVVGAGSRDQLWPNAASWEPDPDLLQRLVTRSDRAGRLERDALWVPSDLNRGPGMLAVIKSGVSVIHGHGDAFVTATTLSAVQLLASLQSLRRVRREAHEALQQLDARKHGDLSQQQVALTKLSLDIEQVELALSFEVEAHMNMRLLIPEHAVEHFHRSLADALGLPVALPATDRLITRLSSVLAARRETVNALQREADDRRQRNWTIVGTCAIPLTVLFGFFGINAREVNSQRSLLDLSAYGAWYALFLVLMVLGVLWARRQGAPSRAAEPAASLARRSSPRSMPVAQTRPSDQDPQSNVIEQTGKHQGLA